MYGPSLNGIFVGFDSCIVDRPTRTPQQVLEMAGMAGHKHAELMVMYAEGAKTHAEPWELWESKFPDEEEWHHLNYHPSWDISTEYRHKLKTHIVNGIAIPDLRISPKYDDSYYLADPTALELTTLYRFTGTNVDKIWVGRGLTYQPTEEGEQAAILHAKAMLGIA